ncbi:glycosyl hydrolase family 28-related protein [Spirosoma aerolatum]|uniref:glycosyl hydrolase family 28-related protein n=1 Tax=Spirosoma aerolatum TaxID=1211326 RepID=UPI0009AD27FE|nr:glycosyl hydrolase family 28-related protein [Spirosoma aerolatum]
MNLPIYPTVTAGRYRDTEADLLHVIWDELTLANNPLVDDPITAESLKTRNAQFKQSTDKEDILAGIALQLQIKRLLGGAGTQRQWLNVKDSRFGAIGDGIADDTAAIQAAINFALASPKKWAIYFPYGVYKCSTVLTLPIHKANFVGDWAKLKFPDITTGNLLTVTGSGSGAPYQQTGTVLEGMLIEGGSKANITNGMYFDTPTESGTSHIRVTDCNVSGCGVGVSFGNNAYCIAFDNLDSWNNGIGIHMPPGTTNTGEGISLRNCVVHGNNIGIKQQNPNCLIQLIGSSVDYNEVTQIEITDGKIQVEAGNLEYRNLSTVPYKISGSGSYLYVNGSWCSSGQNLVYPPTIIQCDNGASATFNNVFMNNLGTSTRRLVGGNAAANVKVEGVRSYSPVTNNALILSDAANVLLDGGFTSASVIDHWRADSVGIGSRTDALHVTNSNLDLSPTYFHSGTQSLKWSKPFGGGSESRIAVMVPIKPGALLGLEYWIKKPGSSIGILYHTFNWGGGFYVDSAGLPSLKRIENFAAPDTTLSAAALDWTLITMPYPYRAPFWATHLYIEINGSGWGAGGESIYLDDFVVTPY